MSTPATMSPEYSACSQPWLEHSGAPPACVWLALLRLDYHSLMRQRKAAIVGALRDRCSNEGVRQMRRSSSKMGLIVAAFSLVHSARERCGRARHSEAKAGRRSDIGQPSPSSQRDVTDLARPCTASFDIRKLPYRWLPGLPLPRAGNRPGLSLIEAAHAPRLEVMHVADYWPGPVWLYHAPGSGVWWSPGRRLAARNVVAAVLQLHPLGRVVAHIEAIGRGDRRLSQYRAWLQWRVAFGGEHGPSWGEILTGAAAGNASFEHFASAGELLGTLLSADETVSRASFDSIILTHQTHFWARGGEWDVSDDGYAPTMVRPCEHERRPSTSGEVMHVRTHRVPEMIDLRVHRRARRTMHGVLYRAPRDVSAPHVASKPHPPPPRL